MTAKHIGFDVSHHQQPALFDWQALGSTPAVIVARATYGTKPDATFPEYARLCREHGVVLGAYHFFRQTEPNLWQIEAFQVAISLIGPGDVHPVLDLEDNTQFDGPALPNVFNCPARAMAEYLRDVYGGCILYYSSYFPAALGNPEWMREPGYRHWVADYGRPAGEPRHPHTPSWHWHQPEPVRTPLYRGGPVDHIYANPEHEPGVMLIGELPTVCGVES